MNKTNQSAAHDNELAKSQQICYHKLSLMNYSLITFSYQARRIPHQSKLLTLVLLLKLGKKDT